MRCRLLIPVLLCLFAFSSVVPGQSASMGDLPLIFEANGGAFGSDVHFVARGRGYRLLATDGGFCLLLGGGRSRHGDAVDENASHAPRMSRAWASGASAGTPAAPDAADSFGAVAADGARRQPAYAVQVRFENIAGPRAPVGEQPLATRIHHLRGADPARWSVDNATFGALRYEQLWSGIDLLLYDAGGELEYDLVVAPGADASAARFSYDGVQELSVDEAGRLHMHTPVGELVQGAPYVYQQQGDARVPVAGAFAVAADGTLGFELGGHDPRDPVVIDPLLLFATYLPGNKEEWTNGLALGPEDVPSIYLAGDTTSYDLPASAGFQPTKHSDDDVFVARLAPDGRSLLWCTYLGGEGSAGYGDDWGYGVAVDDTGAAIVCGTTQSDDFPVTPGAWDTSNPPGHRDGFVAKLAPGGASLEWCTYLGNGSNPYTTKQTVFAVDLGADGSVFAAGQSDNASFPVTAGSFGTTATGGVGFVTRLKADGSGVIWSGVLGAQSGTGNSEINDLEIDASGRAYVAGFTDSSSLPTTANAFDTTYNGGREGFLARISEDGSTLDYCTYLGGAASDCGEERVGVACDDAGRAVFVAHSTSNDYPTTVGALQPTLTAGTYPRDAVVSCVDTDGTGVASLLWSTYLGGTGNDSAQDVAFDAEGNAHVMGWTTSSNFPVLHTIQPFTGAQQIFVAGFDPGGALLYSTWLGGHGVGGQALDIAGKESGKIEVDALGDLYVVADSWSPDAGTTGAYVEGNPGSVSAFAAKLTLRTLWVDLGLGLGGANGTPVLSGVGDPIAGSQVSVVLENGLPFGMGCFVLGLSQWGTPCKGGVLVPQIDIIAEGQLLDALGEHVNTFTWPAGVPVGTTFYLQMWIHDLSGPVDFTASNGLAIVAP